MSTQQQINAWNTAILQKQEELAAQERTLGAQQIQLAREEQFLNDIVRFSLDLTQPATARLAAEEIPLARQRVATAKTAITQTQSNVSSLNESIDFNTGQRDQFQAALPAQANPSSTVADGPANVRSDAAETAPAPTPQAAVAEPVLPNLTSSWNSENGNFDVIDIDNGETIASGLTAEEAARTAGDPFEAARLARAAEFDQEQPDVFAPEPVAGAPGLLDPQQQAAAALTAAPEPVRDFVTDPNTNELVPSDSAQAAEIRAAAAQVQVNAPTPVPDVKYDEFGNVAPNTPEAIAAAAQKSAEQRAAEEQAAAKLSAINQATLQSLYKAVGSSDWRVRLQLAPSSNYLYNVPVNQETGTGPGILAPLAATNGVVFPYTPQINTSYKANYEQYDLVHSNYRGVYYKNSRVDDISIKGTFTAQDTREADYLLAVIHFFRSVTKMFYGKDAERGSPPPLVFLSGLGPNQFNDHPCVVTSFAYNLPDNVDYIRATSVNNYGTDLLSRRTPSRASGTAGIGATGNRILNAGLGRFFPANKPASDNVVASVNNTQLANYVPTKMEIDITLIPVQTRSQVSKQFSLKGFANGDLIKGGFW